MTRIMKSKFLNSVGLLALLCALLSPAVRADGTGLGDLTITLPTISGIAGHLITVSGDLTNTSSNTLYFFSESVNFTHITIGSQLDLVINAPPFGSAPTFINGNSTLMGVDLFSFTIPIDAAPGPYNMNSLDLLGGSDPACILSPCDVLLGTTPFNLTVQGVVPTPEPGTLMLLASGFLAGLLIIRRATQ